MSPERDWRLRIRDIIEYATTIEELTAGHDEGSFRSDRAVQLAVLHCLTIMGEAARHVPVEVQSRCPEVEWRLMNDMRNFLIHAYGRVNLNQSQGETGRVNAVGLTESQPAARPCNG